MKSTISLARGTVNWKKPCAVKERTETKTLFLLFFFHRRLPPRAKAAALAAPHAAYIHATFQQLLTAALRCAS